MELTIKEIEKKINNFEICDRKRLNRLYEYYIGRHNILNTNKPRGKPNNRLVINYAKNIVNNTTGYYLGVPVTYTSQDSKLSNTINSILELNDDSFHNVRIGKDLSVFGKAAEIVFIDEALNIRYKKINPMNLIPVYTDDIEKKLVCAIRWYDVFDDDRRHTRYIEQYTSNEIIYYVQQNGGNIIFSDRKTHFFGDVPINIYSNNDDEMGDYEDVISLIDAYNVMQSESVNDYQKFADALLAIKGMYLDEDTVNDIRDKNILNLQDGNSDAGWLVKSVNDGYVENIKNRLEHDIYMASATVNMSDDNFANNSSGVSLKYKFSCMENRVSQTVNNFKAGIRRRLKLICGILNFKGSTYDFTDIKITFVRNIPANLDEICTMVQQLSGHVSNRTLIRQIPFVTDVEQEINQLTEERGAYPNELSNSI